jgi:hypothetical protein
MNLRSRADQMLMRARMAGPPATTNVPSDQQPIRI